MPIKPDHWKESYPLHGLPAWPCPWHCGGTLVREGKPLIDEETPPSRDAHGDDNWEADWTVEIQAILFRCASCQGSAVLLASTNHDVRESSWNNGITELDDHVTLRPMWLTPMPRIVEIHASWPEEVVKSLDEAFALLWTSPAGALARMRAALEKVLDERRVKRRARKKKPPGTSKTRPLSLHERIKLFAQKHKDAADFLEAAKWLGNEGAHADASLDEVLTAASLMEAALVEVYEDRSRKLKRTAAAINRKKGRV